MPTANEDIRDRILHREALRLRLENRYNGLIRRRFRKHARELRRLIAAGGPQVQIIAKIRRLIRADHAAIQMEILRELRDASRSEKRFARRILENELGAFVSIRTVSDAELLNRLLSSPIRDTRTFTQHWAAIERHELRGVQRFISNGYREGVPTETLARRIQNATALSIAEHQARSIARTALTQFATRSANSVYMENSDIIQGYQYVATLDSRTTPICSSLDGRIFPLNEDGYRPKPPQHFNCRSTTTPIVLGIDEIRERRGLRPGARVTARTRASINGQVPASTNYDSWLRARAYSTRLAHFDGNVQLLEAFDSGVPLDKLVNKRTQKYVMNLDTLDRLVDDYGG